MTFPPPPPAVKLSDCHKAWDLVPSGSIWFRLVPSGLPSMPCDEDKIKAAAEKSSRLPRLPRLRRCASCAVGALRCGAEEGPGRCGSAGTKEG